MELILQTCAILAAITMAVVIHEVAHGYMALLRGDQTAKIMGRLTLNPIAHVHWFGTLVLPLTIYFLTHFAYGQGFTFAFAKPVPVDFRRLRNPKQDMVWVAAAGPGINLILAAVSALIIRAILWLSPTAMELFGFITQGASPGPGASFIHAALFSFLFFFYAMVVFNVILAIINLIPVPPADGGRIVTGLLPDEQAAKYAQIEPYGLGLLILLLFFNPLNIINWTVGPLVEGLVNLLL